MLNIPVKGLVTQIPVMVSLYPLNSGRLGVVSKVKADEMRLVCLASGGAQCLCNKAQIVRCRVSADRADRAQHGPAPPGQSLPPGMCGLRHSICGRMMLQTSRREGVDFSAPWPSVFCCLDSQR